MSVFEVCDYCGETSEYVTIIDKPRRFFYKWHTLLFVQAYADISKKKLVDKVCLECLMNEMDALKEVY